MLGARLSWAGVLAVELPPPSLLPSPSCPSSALCSMLHAPCPLHPPLCTLLTAPRPLLSTHCSQLPVLSLYCLTCQACFGARYAPQCTTACAASAERPPRLREYFPLHPCRPPPHRGAHRPHGSSLHGVHHPAPLHTHSRSSAHYIRTAHQPSLSCPFFRAGDPCSPSPPYTVSRASTMTLVRWPFPSPWAAALTLRAAFWAEPGR